MNQSCVDVFKYQPPFYKQRNRAFNIAPNVFRKTYHTQLTVMDG